MVMNRISIRYTKEKERYENGKHIQSKLEVFNDIKGLCGEKLLLARGHNADMLFKLLTNVDYSNLDNFMNYGITVVDKTKE